MAKADTEVPRRRRTAGEVRELLLKAAKELFTEYGYAGTSTRQIANRADVSEALLFRHFGTKAQLFDAAMLEDYNRFITEFIESWKGHLGTEPVEEVTAKLVVGLYQLMRKRREHFLALIAARAFDSDSVSCIESELSRQLDRIHEWMVTEDTGLPPRYLDAEVSMRAMVGTVMALTVLDEWLLPSGRRRPNHDRILKELTQFVLYGVVGQRPRQKKS